MTRTVHLIDHAGKDHYLVLRTAVAFTLIIQLRKAGVPCDLIPRTDHLEPPVVSPDHFNPFAD